MDIFFKEELSELDLLKFNEQQEIKDKESETAKIRLKKKQYKNLNLLSRQGIFLSKYRSYYENKRRNPLGSIPIDRKCYNEKNQSLCCQCWAHNIRRNCLIMI